MTPERTFGAARRPASRPPLLYGSANAVMGAIFALAAALQYNDPDPLAWAAIYALAAIACALAVARRLPRAASALLALVALAWGALLAPEVIGEVSAAEVFASFAMKDERVELARELGGLLIIALWMALLTVLESIRRSSEKR